MTDSELLLRYVKEGDESAFATLVERHLGWLYATATRQLGGDAHLAQDAVQQVFNDLAAKAARLSRHPALNGWLFTSVRFVTTHLIRTELRRRNREQRALTMSEDASAPVAADAADWTAVQGVLDDALAELSPADREAVLLRYFEQRDYATIGARLRLSANATRMRLDRALDKLNAALRRRGITSTAAALGATLTTYAGGTAPLGLVPAITGTALASGPAAAATGWFATLLTSAQTPLIVASAAVVGGILLLKQPAPPPAPPSFPLPAPPSPTVTASPSAAIDRGLADLATEAAALQARIDDLDRAAAATAAPALPAKSPEQLDAAPKLDTQVRPSYPEAMREAGISGEVVVAVIVARDGSVQGAEAVSATNDAFAAAALKAIAGWHFEPGRKGGRTVNTRMEIPIRFDLNQGANPVPADDWF